MTMLSDEQKWMLVSTGSAVAAASLVRFALGRGWEAATGQRPPKNPAAPGAGWASALAWGVGTGVVVSMARVVAERAAAGAWTRSRGYLPLVVRRQRARI